MLGHTFMVTPSLFISIALSVAVIIFGYYAFAGTSGKWSMPSDDIVVRVENLGKRYLLPQKHVEDYSRAPTLVGDSRSSFRRSSAPRKGISSGRYATFRSR